MTIPAGNAGFREREEHLPEGNPRFWLPKSVSPQEDRTSWTVLRGRPTGFWGGANRRRGEVTDFGKIVGVTPGCPLAHITQARPRGFLAGL